MIPNIDRVTAIIRKTAAAEIMPRFQNLASGDISEKEGPDDYVTTADLEAEKILCRELTALVPNSAVIGEEAADTNPDVISAIKGDRPVWILDPVDGTRNFVHGKACFVSIVAYCVGGITLAGWIHDPVADVTTWAAAGKGAWTGGARLHVAPAPTEPSDMRGSLGKRLQHRMSEAWRLDTNSGNFVRYYCVGREYMDLSSGALHFARYAGKVKPWDHAAGTLIHREAGGCGLFGSNKAPYGPARGVITDDFLLMAPDEETWDTLHAAMKDR